MRGLSGAPRACGVLMMVAVLAGCRTGPSRLGADDVPVVDLLARSRSLIDDDPEAAAEDAEIVIQRSADPEVVQEALYLAGTARHANEQDKKAYRHFETLLQDYPYSDFIPAIEEKVYGIGVDYLAREPSWLFKDLFSGRPFGAEVMRQFAAAYPFSARADDALMAIAEYYDDREEYLFSADKYQMVATRYSGSEWEDAAAFREGLSYQRASRGSGYDDQLMRRARRAHLEYLARDDLTGHRIDAQRELQVVEETLAEGELEVARFYLLREQDRGARIHLANVVLAFPGTPAAAEARNELEARGWDVSLHSLDTLQGRLDG